MRAAPLRAFFVACGALALASSAAAGEPTTRLDFPCAGCITVIPGEAADGPVPLLVVLHGDDGSPAATLAPWRRVARDRGVALLAPRCPKRLGCERSYWQWNGDPRFLDEQVDALAGALQIAEGRVYLAGWSGGASYLARAAARLSDRWAAIALAGGGMPPDEGCPRCPRPTYYLAGDRNPLFDLTARARARLVACGVPVRWELLRGRDHGGELAELSRPARAADILDYLLAAKDTCAAAAPLPAASEPPPRLAPPPTTPAPSPMPAPRPRAWSCALAPASTPIWPWGSALALVAARGRGRKRRLPIGGWISSIASAMSSISMR